MRSAGCICVAFRASIPAGNVYLPLVVRIDQPGQVAEHQPVLVAEARSRQQHGGQCRVGDVNGQPGRNQYCLARRHGDRTVDARTHIQPGRTARRVVRQRNRVADARIENLQLY